MPLTASTPEAGRAPVLAVMHRPSSMHLMSGEVVTETERPQRDTEGQDGCPLTWARSFRPPPRPGEAERLTWTPPGLFRAPQAPSLGPAAPLCPPALAPPLRTQPSCPHLAGLLVHWRYHIQGTQNETGWREGQCAEGLVQEEASPPFPRYWAPSSSPRWLSAPASNPPLSL